AVPVEERPEFLQRLRRVFHGLPIAAQLEWDLCEIDETAHGPTAPVPAIRPAPQISRASP
ncbi:MAG: hypothetical protein OEY28_13570, partial [Nitrospira sp.]|nr:hypothetical protein [Nitrospira sp.]